MARLGLIVPQGATEPLASFASRLGAAQGTWMNLQTFLTDMKVRLSDVAAGRTAALTKIADRGGADPDQLDRFTPKRLSSSYLELADEQLPRATCFRNEVRVCPGCLREDVTSSGLPPDLEHLAPHSRASWLVSHLRTCPVHDLPLVTLPYKRGNFAAPDFVQVVRPYLPRFKDPANDPPSRKASDLDLFVSDRIAQGRGPSPSCLDRLDLHTVARFAEVLGATMLWGGKGILDGLSDDDLALAGARGFEVIAHGRAALAQAFEVIRTTRGKPQDKPRGRYAPAYDWLEREAGRAPNFQPFRAVLQQHILERWPLGPGDEVLGIKVTERQLHSIRTLRAEVGELHAATLRKLLSAAGMVEANGDEIGDAAEVFPAEPARRIVDPYICAYTFEAAQVVLGMPRSQMNVLVDKEGPIRPMPLVKGMRPMLAREEVERFRDAIEARLVPYDPTASVLPIQAAVKSAKVKAPIAVRAILDGTLPVMRRPGTTGYQSLLIDPVALRDMIHGVRDPSLLTVPDLAKRLDIPDGFVRQLIERGHLTSERRLLPRMAVAATVVTQASLEAFQVFYVSDAELARDTKVNPDDLRARFGAAGINIAIGSERRSVVFYRRSEVSAQLNAG